MSGQMVLRAAEALAEAYTSNVGPKNPDWDIDKPDDDETNPYYLERPMSDRVQMGAFITFQASDGYPGFRPASLVEIAQVLAEAGLLHADDGEPGGGR